MPDEQVHIDADIARGRTIDQFPEYHQEVIKSGVSISFSVSEGLSWLPLLPIKYLKNNAVFSISKLRRICAGLKGGLS